MARAHGRTLSREEIVGFFGGATALGGGLALVYFFEHGAFCWGGLVLAATVFYGAGVVKRRRRMAVLRGPSPPELARLLGRPEHEVTADLNALASALRIQPANLMPDRKIDAYVNDLQYLDFQDWELEDITAAFPGVVEEQRWSFDDLAGLTVLEFLRAVGESRARLAQSP